MSLSDTSGGFWRSARQLPARTPLRVKLITAVLALVAVALAVISIAGTSVLKNYLLAQPDERLHVLSLPDGAPDAVRQFLGGLSPGASPQGAVDWIPAGGQLKQVIQQEAAGAGTSSGFGQPRQPGQPKTISGPRVRTDASWLSARQGHIVTVPALSGGGRWRVLIEHETYQTSAGSTISGTVIVGVDVTAEYATIGRLAAIDLIVSLAIILGLAVVGIAVVRASLRPLIDIERTAGAIAAGDLTRRVPDRDPRTEVGRLGRSLNAMLAQIETAFGARAASESAARRSEERMRQFVADASHELRTPLTTIRGFAEYYRQRGGLDLTPGVLGPNGPPAAGNGSLPPADLDRIMGRVEQESARMGVLVEDMLLLARLDQQRPLDHRTVDLLTLAADAVHDARLVAPERGINLTVSSGAALLVIGDEVRLRQVIGNLMSNAMVHTPDGTPIDVRLRSGSFDEGAPPAATPASATPASATPAGAGPATSGMAQLTARRSAAVLEVADRGPGLTPAQAERAFERFYRADQARTAGGTGLGLAIVAALVAAHGGRVWVESPPAGGAIFRIALPLAPEALGHDAEQDDEEHEQRDQRDQPVPDIADSHPVDSDRQPPQLP
jgi:two-component system, OmpR family, sensor kinase